MTTNRKTVIRIRKTISKAKTATRKAARKGKRYLDEMVMAETEALAEEKWPFMLLKEYTVTLTLTGRCKVELEYYGDSILTETIPPFPEISEGWINDRWDYVFEPGEYQVDCYALNEEHAKEIALNRFRELIEKEVTIMREKAAFAEFQATNLPELLGLA